MHHFIPFGNSTGGFVGYLITFFPVEEIPLEFFIRDSFPVIHEYLPFFHGRQGVLWEGAFDLCYRHLISGCYHQEIRRIQFSEFYWQLFELLHGVMVEGFGTVSYLTGGVVDTIRQRIADSLTPHDFIHNVIEPAPDIFRHSREVLIC